MRRSCTKCVARCLVPPLDLRPRPRDSRPLDPWSSSLGCGGVLTYSPNKGGATEVCLIACLSAFLNSRFILFGVHAQVSFWRLLAIIFGSLWDYVGITWRSFWDQIWSLWPKAASILVDGEIGGSIYGTIYPTISGSKNGADIDKPSGSIIEQL